VFVGRVCLIRQGFFPLDTRVRREVHPLLAAGREVDVICLRRDGQPLRERLGAVTALPLPIERAGPLRYVAQYAAFLAAAGLLAAAVALVIVLATSGSSDNGSAPKPQASAPKPAPQKPSKPAQQPSKPKPSPAPAHKAHLVAFGSSGASGTAALSGGGQRLVIKASGLPSATYQVWLYNSVIDAASLTKVSGTSVSLDLKLPANASHYRYVDISREPDDGNPNHSGESVLRVALKKLSR
jgi:hypothetical protein